MLLRTLLPVLLCSLVFCNAKECNEGESCVKASSCDWFNDKNDQRRHAKKGSDEYNQILEELKGSICDNKAKTVCCPEGPVERSILWGRSCLSRIGDGKCKSKSECRASPGYSGFSYSRECGRNYGYSCCKTQESTAEPSEPVEIPARTRIPHTNKVFSSGNCGTFLKNYIFGGQEAEPGSFPWMVSFVDIDKRHPNSPPYSICGGTLITPRHVLTAAHCFEGVDPSDWKTGALDVRLGLLDIRDDENPLATARIVNVTIHEDYKFPAPGKAMPINDIAIVTLNKDIPLGRRSGVNVACLPREEGVIRPNRTAVVAGWGTTSQATRGTKTEAVLRFAYVKEFSRSVCQAKWQIKYGSAVVITDDMLCAGSPESDTCGGDSGGPLMWLNEDYKYVVAGIVSFGPNSCGNFHPGVYTKVEKYLGWIEKETT